MRNALETLSTHLKTLHKFLIERERESLEKRLSRQLSPLEFYKLLLSDPDLSWLQPLLGVIARLDALVDESDVVTQEVFDRARFDVESILLNPNFQARYDHYKNNDPSFRDIHGNLSTSLNQGRLH